MLHHIELVQELKGLARRTMKQGSEKARKGGRKVLRMPPMQRFTGLQNLEHRLLLAANAFGYADASHDFQNFNLTPGDGGVVSVLDNTDDGTASIDLGANTFTFYGTQYTGAGSLFVSDNGLITFGTGSATPTNSNLASSPAQAAIAVMWDDWSTEAGENDQVLAKFIDVNNDGTNDGLIIEWNEVAHATGGGSVTFQAVLRLNTGSADGDIVFNYIDSTTGNSVANGASATVGLKNANGAEDGADQLLVSQNTGSASLLGDGQSVRIATTALDTTAPTVAITAITPDPINTAVSTVTFTFDEAVTAFDINDITLTRDGGVNLLTGSETLGSEDGGTTWTLSGISGLTAEEGEYTVAINAENSGIIDGQLNFIALGDTDTWTVDTTAPTAEVTPVSPELRTTPVSSITITFSEAVANFTAADLALTVDGGANLLDGSETLETEDNITWTLGNLSALTGADGAYVLTVTAAGITDAATNVLVSDINSGFTVDATAPNAPGTPNLASASDSGSSNTDDLTNVTTPTLTGTAEAGSIVEVFVDAVSQGFTDVDGEGHWTFTITEPLAVGTRTITAKATDAAGNESDASAGLDVLIDVASPDAPGTPNLATASDTGFSDNDDITEDTTPTFTGTAEANSTVHVFVNGEPAGTETADGNGDFSVTLDVLPDGTFTITATSTDAAGNTSTSSSSLQFTIDTSAPEAPSAPDLASGSDSGISDSDNLTNATTPTVSGTAEAFATVEVFVDGVLDGATLADENGNWTYEIQTPMNEGGRAITAQATDFAGNASAVSTTLNVTVDVTAPTADVVDVDPDPRNKTVKNLAITFSEAVTGFDLNDVTLTLEGGENLVTGSQTLNTSDNISFTLGNLAGITGGQGTFAATVVAGGSSITDAAGNAFAVDAADEWETDTVAPTIAITVTPDPSNAAISSITITASEVINNLSIEDLVLTLDGGANILTGGQSLDTNDNITFTLSNLAGITGTDGVYVLSLVASGSGVEDNSGNLLDQDASEVFTIDTTAPDAPSPADLASGSDTGASVTDDVTYETNPTLTGTAEANATIEVFVDGVSDGTTVADAEGNWTYTIETALTEGARTITSKATDAATNESVASAGLVVNVDFTSPDEPATPNLVDASDTGSSDSDDITSDNTPQVTGTADANAEVVIYSGENIVGSGTADGNGDYSITLSVLADGTHFLLPYATDLAGNQSTSSNHLTITVDTTAPSAPATPNLDAASDSGLSDTDDNTTDTTPTLNGNAEANATIEVFVDGVSDGSTTADGDGAWTYTIQNALSDGAKLITAKATDASGNVSIASSALTVTVDNDAPSAPGAANLDSESDTGTSASDDLTSATTPTLTGTAEAGAQVEVFVDGVSDGTTFADGEGNWSYTIQSALTAGVRTITSKATDAAGNESVASAGFDVTVDASAPAAPSTPDMLAGNDSGSSNSDNITSDSIPAVTGTAEANAIIHIYRGELLVGTGAADGDGDYSIVLDVLADGSFNLTATATDAAGNTSASSGSLSATIDSAAPSAPGTPDLATASDTGGSDNDDITSDTTPTVNGTAEANATVEVFVNGVSDGTTTADGDGLWSHTVGAQVDGDFTITATATDTAGNASDASEGLVVSIDTDAPSAPSAANLASASDTGTSSSDDLTSDTTPTLTGTAEAFATVEVFIDGVSDGATLADEAGNWSYAIQSALTAGVRTITTKATDFAGNESVASTGLDVTVDASAPAAPSSPDLQAASDSGSSDADDNTSDTTPTLTGTAEADSIVNIYIGDVLVGTGTATGGNYSITLGVTPDGTHTVFASATDAAGNVSTNSTSLELTVDTAPPSAPGTPDLAAGSDSGASDTDDNTSDTTPTISGVAEANATVEIFVDGVSDGSTTADGDGAWSYTINGALNEGDRVLTAKATDAAGNVSVASTGLTVTVDTSAPSAPGTANLDAESDTGTSSTDDLTNATTPTFTGTAEAGATVEVFVNGDSDGTTTADENGDWSYALTSALSAGSFTITTKATDAAGNESAASSDFDFDVDATAPNAPSSPDLQAADDSGTSSSDNDTDVTAPTFTGTAEAGSSVNLFIGDVLVGTGTATGGNYSITINVQPDGAYTIFATATDAAGNTSTSSGSLNFTVDTTAPSAPGTPDLAAGSDTGSSSTDNNTSDTTPTVTGTAEANSSVEVFVDGVSDGTTTADGEGNWSFDVGALVAGTYTITAKATDAAGNVSVASTGLSVTVDTAAPSAPSTADLAEASDTGTSSTDNLTNDTTATFTGTAEANSTVTVFVDGNSDGTTTADGSGNWSYTIQSALSAGLHTITSKATDAAGNQSAASTGFDVTIDVAAPSAPSAPDLTSGSDTGHTSNDNDTSDNTPTVTGTAEADSIVNVYIGDVLVGTGTATGGAYSITLSVLANGTHTVLATATDAAGNTSSSSSSLSLTIDAAAPSAPSTPNLADASDTGDSSSDDITSDNTPTVTGTAEANATIELFVDGASHGTTTADGEGNWSFTFETLSEGAQAVTAKATDAAGNESVASTGLVVTVDTTAPSAPEATDLSDDSDTGAASDDNLTNDTTPTITGLAEANSTVEIFVDGESAGTTTADGEGFWSFTFEEALAPGNYGITAKATDAAGNISNTGAGLEVSLDTEAPTVDITDVSPDPRETSVESITIVFSEAVADFTLADLSLTRNAGENLITDEQTLTTEDNITWTLGNMAGLTGTGGQYFLNVNASGITDNAGNAVSEDASDLWSFNTQPPTLTLVSTLAGAIKNTAFTITYADLAAAANEADADNNPISFKIAAVTTGTLTKDGEPVIAGTTTVSEGEVLTWTPATNATGTLKAFTIRANDGFDDSASAVQVRVAVEKPTVTLTVIDADAAEDGSDTATFEVTRNGNTDAELVVSFSTGGTARNASDYTRLTGRVTIAAGEESATITLTPIDDVLFEGDQTATLTLRSSSAYQIDDEGASASATITDDEPTISVTSSDDEATEAALSTGEFTITLSHAVDQDVRVFLTVGGTASRGSDYDSLVTSVIIAAGDTTATLTVTPNQDARVENEETVTLTLRANSAYGIDGEDSTATVTLADDEPTVSVTATDAAAAELGTDPGQFTFELSHAVDQDTTVHYSVGGTARNGTDYNVMQRSVIIAAGQTSATVTVTPKQDTRFEQPETVVVTLSNRSTYRVDEGAKVATVTIADDEPTISVTATDALAGETGLTTGTFTFTRTGATTGPITVFFSIGGTARNKTDYNALLTAIVIPAGESSATLTITPKTDTRVEGNETVTVTLRSSTGYGIDGDFTTATVTLADAVLA